MPSINQNHAESNWALVKRVMQLSLPMAGSRFIQMFSGFVGTMMVAHLGHDALAASALMSSTQTLIIVFAISVLFAVSVCVGEAFGAQRYDDIGAMMQQAMLLIALLTPPFAVITWFTPNLLLKVGQSPALVGQLVVYFHILAFFIAPIMLQVTLEQFASAVLKQRLVIIVNAINMLLFFVYCYFLIFGLAHHHGLGFIGLSLAWGIQDLCNIGLLIWAFAYFDDFKRYRLFAKRSHAGWIYLKKIFQIGWPMSAQFGGELSAMVLRVWFMGWIGVGALAAIQITQQVTMIMVVPLFAMSEAAGILVSQHKGANEPEMIGRAGDMSLYVALLFCLVPVLIFTFLPNITAALYLHIHDPANAHTLILIKYMFIIMAVNFAFIVLGDMMSGALRGIFDTKWPMWNSLLFSWVINIPLSYWFGFTFGWGAYGVMLGSSIAIILRGIGVWLRWRWQLRQIRTSAKLL